MSSIQYTNDSVTFSGPDGVQTDWEALIAINFVRQNNDGSYTAPYLYVQNVTGASSYYQLLDMHQAARKVITDATLLAFAAALDAQTSSNSSSSSTSSSSPAQDIPDPGAQ